MSIEEKIILNKKIRKYEGTNSFVISLKKQLSSTKANKIEFDGKTIKILSDKQYDVVKSIID